MSLPASDDFNRANGALGANWTDLAIPGGSAPTVVSNTAQATDTTQAAAFWSADSFPDDQYAELTVIDITPESDGPLVRASGSGASSNWYGTNTTASGITLMKMVSGSGTTLGTFGSSAASGDVIKVSVVGNTIQCFKNGVQQDADCSDSALVSGSAGFYTFRFTVGAVDDWSGGSAELAGPLWTAQGPLSGATFADDAAVGTVAFTNPGNVAASDDTYASCVLGNFGVSHYLKVSDFGFSIPSHSQIVGIVAEIECSSTLGSATTDSTVKLIKGGSIGGTNKTNGQAWLTTDSDQTYGSTDDLWGRAWTPADINASDFGIAISVTTTNAATAKIDHVRLAVYYIGSNQPQGIVQQFQAGDGMSISERHSLIRQH